MDLLIYSALFCLHVLTVYCNFVDVVVDRYDIPRVCPREVGTDDFIRYHFNGTFFEDGKKFDSSYDRGKAFISQVGFGRLIAGMDRGLQGMCVNEKRRITIPPHLAYGSIGAGEETHDEKLSSGYEEAEIGLEASSETPSTVSSDQFDSPSITTLGANMVIPGLEEGLRGMCVGERREVVVPPHWGHGENGAGDVPGSAVLFFELELVKLQKGIPEGFMFVWLGDSPDPLFPAMDLNGDKEVPLEEFSAFIMLQVKEAKGRLRPGFDAGTIIQDMFNNQDLNKDGKIIEDELKLQGESQQVRRDEL
ncbi:peptidyl-prolyl cis-trans isomerase FKBP10-like [Notothenia coriiceps]|uniref:peptidylprolyl isomerase n=1 Tax=Notothenia coriiceps TaxID=8208 RepID=A0A6I9NGU9_9TELE|nr:PREDICTED: peptidyl-prolyl cis-trans isomerase FKBP10-like [Notothenia coriiceps]